MNTAKIYRLRPFTNLHVGSGETNFGVVDNLIQRDATTGFPCVHSSGLKGAIKQLFDRAASIQQKALIKAIFGSDAAINKNPGAQDAQQGESFFFSAQLLAIPVRSEKVPYLLATCPSAIRYFTQTLADFNLQLTPAAQAALQSFAALNATEGNTAPCLNRSLANSSLAATNIKLTAITTEQLSTDAIQQLQSIFGITDQNLCILSDAEFRVLSDDLNLPVIARNALDDGESKNLWYEQVLPRESLLYFPMIWKDEDHKTAVEEIILNYPVQLGGNASVGYGFTRITPLV